MSLPMFFSVILNMSVSASILVFVILFVKSVFNRRLGASWHYGIWFVLVLKLLVPVAPISSISLFNLVNKIAYNIFGTKYIFSEGYNGNSFYAAMNKPSFGAWDQDLALSVDHSFWNSPYNILFLIWLIGVIALSIRIYLINTRYWDLLKNRRVISDSAAVSLFEQCKERLGIKANIQLTETPCIDSPALLGLIKPCLLIPEKIIDTLGRDQLKYVMLHELAHFKRKDILINWVTSLLQVFHWFNPLVWLAFNQMRRDRELACDAYVLSKISSDEHKNYGHTIISVLEFFTSHSTTQISTGFLENKQLIKKRITMIALFKKGSRKKAFFEIVLALTIGSMVLTGAQPVIYGSDQSTIPFEKVKYEDLSTYFKGYKGSFVLYDLKKKQCTIYGKEESVNRISPCSTFKIVDALIGLQENVLQDEKSSLVWDGTTYPFQQWNQDQTLASAMKYSVDWYFQKVSAQIGEANMLKYLKNLEYGNKDTSGGIEKFWQQSTLKVSAVEQVQLLANMYTYDGPFSRNSVDTVKDVMRLYQDPEKTLAGKTGTGIENGKYINGWFVGYVESNNQVFAFATNIQSTDHADGKTARNITLSILEKKNIFTAPIN